MVHNQTQVPPRRPKAGPCTDIEQLNHILLNEINPEPRLYSAPLHIEDLYDLDYTEPEAGQMDHPDSAEWT